MSVKSCDVNSELENDPPDTAASHIEQGLQQGLNFCADKQWADAAACFEAVVAQDPTHKIAWNNLGNVRDELGDTQGAYQAFQAALALDPDYTSPKKNLAIVAYKEGCALYAAGKLQEALDAFGVAASQGQNSAEYDHSYLQLLLETCEHTHVQTHTFAMQVRSAQEGSYQPHPYPLLAATDMAAWHLLIAKRHVTRLCTEAGVRVTRAVATWPQRQERIRVAYISCDWHVHPVPQQLIASIETQDRSQFDVIGIATDAIADNTPWRQRIERAFDGFYALGQLSDSEIADELRRLNVDIAIDLSLYMQNGRPLILASRPCSVQVAYLGYAGTSGAPWIDYLIADDVVIPPAHESFYSEKILRLPGSFMPDNNQRPAVPVPHNRLASRTLQGLPESAFVFCAFSNPYKITPELLRAWFRLLHATPTGVLWLQANNEVTKAHIEMAALAAGLTADRIVFATRLDHFDAHLQRYALADLFLDSFPYNAHVTAADALWAGLPVLTLQGQSFASRVASSILTALNLPELITTDLASYEARALELAGDAKQLKKMRNQLAQSKAEGRYFNQTHYAKKLDAALASISNPAPKRLISFSLWGSNPTYLMGALRNAQLAAKHYPDWFCRFYCADDLPQDYLNQLQTFANVEIVLMPPTEGRGGAFWRFMAAADAHVSHVLFRDTDSRIDEREVAAVNEWLASHKAAHIMRDHPFHWTPIMAGMWGCKAGVLTKLKTGHEAQLSAQEYGADQQFLAEVIYPQIKNDCVIHDAFNLSEAGLDVRPFPTQRQGLFFVGQCYDEHDQPNTYYEQALAPMDRL